jgi:hypothetical protein
MNISYERITEVNKGINYTQVKGKNYAEVAQRVQAFRNLIPGGYITTEIIKFEPGVVYMKAECGYYENGQKVMLATGMAFERQDASNVNKTSYIENCETSAIGRALGFIGLGSEASICSVEELTQALNTQNAIAQGIIPESATVTPVDKVPDIIPVMTYLANECEELRKARNLTKAENKALWNKQIEVLRANKIIPDKALSSYTQKEAETMVAFMYSRFETTGTELLPE